MACCLGGVAEAFERHTLRGFGQVAAEDEVGEQARMGRGHGHGAVGVDEGDVGMAGQAAVDRHVVFGHDAQARPRADEAFPAEFGPDAHLPSAATAEGTTCVWCPAFSCLKPMMVVPPNVCVTPSTGMGMT